MKEPKNEGPQAMAKRVRFARGWTRLFALMLIAGIVTLSAIGPAQVALADAGGGPGHAFDVTFTKWIVGPGTPPVVANMAGVVGGDVGQGTFTGEVLKIGTVGNTTSIEALYHMHGSRHSFTAHVYVTQNNQTNTATIAGRVTEGWLEGARVTGAYKVLASCAMNPNGNCFQGALSVLRGFRE